MSQVIFWVEVRGLTERVNVPNEDMYLAENAWYDLNIINLVQEYNNNIWVVSDTLDIPHIQWNLIEKIQHLI